jgi:hypothetical protein
VILDSVPERWRDVFGRKGDSDPIHDTRAVGAHIIGTFEVVLDLPSGGTKTITNGCWWAMARCCVETALFTAAVPCITTATAIVLLGEHPSAIALAGVFVVRAGMAMTLRRR